MAGAASYKKKVLMSMLWGNIPCIHYMKNEQLLKVLCVGFVVQKRDLFVDKFEYLERAI